MNRTRALSQQALAVVAVLADTHEWHHGYDHSFAESSTTSPEILNMHTPLPRIAARVALFVLLLLLLPAAGAVFGGMDWGPGDFAAAGALLFGAGMTYAVGSQKVRTTRQRVLVGISVLLVLCVVWAELAVGLFD